MKLRHIFLSVLIAFLNMSGARAYDAWNIFKEGSYWYEHCTIDGIDGVRIINVAWADNTLSIPRDVTHDGTTYLILSLGSDMCDQIDIDGDDGERGEQNHWQLNAYDVVGNVTRVEFGSDVELRSIEDWALMNMSHNCDAPLIGTIIIPASVTYIGDLGLYPERPFEQVWFAEGTKIENMPGHINAHSIHVPASVRSISEKLMQDWYDGDNVVTDIYLESAHVMNPKLNGNWNRTHTLHVPVGATGIFNRSKWVTEYKFVIEEDKAVSGGDVRLMATNLMKDLILQAVGQPTEPAAILLVTKCLKDLETAYADGRSAEEIMQMGDVYLKLLAANQVTDSVKSVTSGGTATQILNLAGQHQRTLQEGINIVAGEKRLIK